MVEPAKMRILIVDDDAEIASLIEFTLQKYGFVTDWAENGEKGIEKVFSNLPNLILLDIDMPGMNGFEFCRKIRSDFRVRHLPVMMMTGTRRGLEDKIKGLDLGSDDYILKPFEPDELVARVKSILQRCARDLDASPLTHLPGNTSVIKEIEKRIAENAPFAAIYVDLNHFKAFNDKYGFMRGDEVIKFVAKILLDLVSEKPELGDFVGHIGGDDFVIVTGPDRAQDCCDRIIQRFDAEIVNFYDIIDRDAKEITTIDRRGIERKFSIMTIALGIVHNLQRPFFHAGQVGAIATELKSFAKTFGVSKCVTDRRKT